jgi:glycolate oxidase FAD binding subunit
VSDSAIAPDSIDQLREIVSTSERVLGVGNQTKPCLCSAAGAQLVSLRSLRGMITYEPSEFTFTAHAGTKIEEINQTLKEKGQYLPFDPMLVDAGATLGGTVASGLSGPGRLRYGGIRDFLLGVRFISGDGHVINAGGKVVKNAAGFDIPKFMIGSAGRLGVMTELTFKVFPAPERTRTLSIACQSSQQAIDRIAVAAASRWEADAIDYRPSDGRIYLRLAGPGRSCDAIAGEVQSTWGSDVAEVEDPDAFWQAVRELNWSADHRLAVKVPIQPSQLKELDQPLADQSLHLSVAGNVVWMLIDDQLPVDSLDELLDRRRLAGLVLRDAGAQPRLGRWPTGDILAAVKTAMDPPARFPEYV